jgi:hypothetical protein
MTSVELLLDISSNEMKDIVDDYLNNDDNKISKTDREIFYSDIFYKEGDKWHEKYPIIESFIVADEYIEYLNFIISKNEKTSSKINEKTIFKKILEFQSINTDFSSLSTVSVKKYKNQYIVNRNSISVPFPVKALIDKNEYLIPPNTNFIIKSFSKRPIYSLDNNNKFKREINENLNKFSYINNVNLNSENGGKKLISKIAKYISNISIENKIILLNPVLIEENNRFNNKFTISQNYSGEYNKKLLNNLNSFLYSKLFSTNISNLYNCFDIDSKLHVLEKLYIKGENDLEVRNIISSLLKGREDENKYNKNILALLKQQSELSRLEFMCKKKFPNLFNKNSKELLFTERNRFSLDKIPKKYKSILLSEYNLRKSYEKKILESNCGHILSIEKLKTNASSVGSDMWKEVLQWLEPNEDKESGFHNCVSCTLPALCSHDYFFYSNYGKKEVNYDINKLSKIMKHTVNKFMATGGAKGFMYCKVCGQELANVMEEENVVGYDDSKNMYKQSDESENDSLQKLVYFIVSRNMSIGAASSANSVISNILTNITQTIRPIVESLKKKKKFKKKDSLETSMDKQMEMNIVIMVIVSIMILSIKFKFIGFKKNKSIKDFIVPKNEKDIIKFKFKEAFDVFSHNYINLIKETNYSNKMDIIKELFVKIYMLIKDNLSESISISEDNIKNFITVGVAEDYIQSYTPAIFDKHYLDYTLSIPVANAIVKKQVVIKGGRQQTDISSNIWYKYKNISYESFKTFVDKKLYEVYHDSREVGEWKEWKNSNLEIINIENKLKEINKKQTLHPYGHIPYSYERYFKGDKWENDMGLYACSKTGRRHVWGSYLFSIEKEEDVEIIIKNTGNELKKISKGKLKSIRCKECKLTTEELINEENGKKNIFENIVELRSNINGFYIVFRYRCLKYNEGSGEESFHDFEKVDNKNDRKCKKCSVLFSQLLNKDVKFYNENSKIYKKYIDNLNVVKNKELQNTKKTSDNILSLDYKKINTQSLLGENIKEIMNISTIDKMNQLEITKFSILSKTGETENVMEKDIEEMEPGSNVNKNDVFLKILDRIREICVIVGIIYNNPIKHKYTKNIEFIDMLNNVIRKDNDGSVESLYKKYILSKNFVKLCWEYRNDKGLDEGISFSKSCMYDIMINVKKTSEVLYEYIIKKITEIDILYTGFNYAEIKKIFNVSKIVEDDIENAGTDAVEEYTDDSDLFDSSDLSMNNFEDDDLDNDV